MNLVILSLEEVEEALLLAQRRNDKPEFTNKKFNGIHGNEEIHFMSALAEMAWSKQTGWPIDRSIRYGDGGIDFVANGRTYQIKARDTRRYAQPDLLCRINYAKADRYVLAEVDLSVPKEITFVGWCTKEELISETIEIRGKGKRYIRRRSDLRTMPRSYT